MPFPFPVIFNDFRDHAHIAFLSAYVCALTRFQLM